MSDSIIGTCKQKGCNAANDGKCIDGFDKITDCPHFTVEKSNNTKEEIPEKSEADKDVKEKAPDLIDLYDGANMDIVYASDITRKEPARLIVVAGFEGAGKTTILASIYECFLKGPFAGYMFAGSYTLPDYEKVCYLARTASERQESDTERTKVGAKNLLHLCVKSQELEKNSQNILFTDFSGERFRLAKDSEESCKKLSVLKMADCIMLLIDGEKLINKERRHEVYQDADMLIRSFLDADMIRKNCVLYVLFTKWDIIEEAKENKANYIEFIDNKIKKYFIKKFKGKFKEINFFNVAARPKTDILDFAYGLEDIFPLLVENKNVNIDHLSYIKNNFSNKSREFDKYIYRHFNLLS